MSISLGVFINTAQQATESHSLRLSGNDVKENSGFRHAIAWASTHRQAMCEFLNALKAEFGDQIANLAAASLNRGQPLTARNVKEVVALAHRINEALGDFTSGADHGGQPIAHSLDAAIGQWLTSHPAQPPLDPQQLAQAKAQIACSLMDGQPPCTNVDEMFQAVSEGRLPFMQAMAREIEENLASPQFQAALQMQFAPLGGLEQGEAEQLSAAIGAKALAGCGGGFLATEDPQVLFAAATQEVFEQFAGHCEAIRDSGLPQAAQSIVRSWMFRSPQGAPPSVIGAAARDNLIERRCNLEANQALVGRLTDKSEGSLLREAIGAALASEGLPDEAELPPAVLRAVADAVHGAILGGNKGLDAAISESDGRAILQQAANSWASGLKAAMQRGSPAEQAVLREAILGSPRLLEAGYIQHLQETAGGITTDMLRRLTVGTLSSRIKALGEINQAVQAQMNALPEALRGEGTEGKEAWLSHFIPLALIRLDLPQDMLGGLRNALLSEDIKALKAFLHFDGMRSPHATGVFSTLMHLQRGLDDLAGVDRAAQLQAYDDFPHAGTVDDLPSLARLLVGSHLSGNMQLPDTPSGTDAVLAEQKVSQALKHDLGDIVPHQLISYLTPDALTAFEKDLPRTMDLVVGGVRLDNASSELPSQTIIQRGYDALAGFLFPGKAFNGLEEGQKRQVALLAGLCNQELQKPARRAGFMAINAKIDDQRGDGTILFNATEIAGRRTISLRRRQDGNISLEFLETNHYRGVDVAGGEMSELNPVRSQGSTSLKLVVSPDELQRLAGFDDWEGLDASASLPDDHHMQFVDFQLQSALHLET
jgi:hypothetical protein